MSKKAIKMHQKGESNGVYQAARLESSVKKFGHRAVRKAKQSKKA